ncbi:MAG: phosphoribosylanthranilate isomerase [Lysobacterales bacterium]
MSRQTKRTRIKFCGLTTVADALAAAALGVDAIGLIFVATSRRCLDPVAAQRIAAALPPLVSRVGLFQNQDAATVRTVLAAVDLDLLQFHGDESGDFCGQFGKRWLKAVPMGALADPDQLQGYLAAHAGAAGYVFDSHGGSGQGGSGRPFDWRRLPALLDRPLILAGGLNAGNVAAAIRQLRPFAVDVSSGIESAPGIKDHAKMRLFVEEVRRAERD